LFNTFGVASALVICVDLVLTTAMIQAS